MMCTSWFLEVLKILATIHGRKICFSVTIPLRPRLDSVNKESIRRVELLTELREEEESMHRVRWMSYNERMAHYAGEVNEEQIESSEVKMRNASMRDGETNGWNWRIYAARPSQFRLLVRHCSAFLFSPL